MSREKIYNFIKNRVSKEKLESWTGTLRGFNPRKRDEMLRRFSDRLPALKEINNSIENIVNEFNISREFAGEQLRKLQKEYKIGEFR